MKLGQKNKWPKRKMNRETKRKKAEEKILSSKEKI